MLQGVISLDLRYFDTVTEVNEKILPLYASFRSKPWIFRGLDKNNRKINPRWRLLEEFFKVDLKKIEKKISEKKYKK